MAMTEIRFYHLQRTALEAALPPMLEKTLELSGSELQTGAKPPPPPPRR